MRENRTHGSEGGDGESRFRPLSVPSSPGFPLKACGNDGLRKEIKFHVARCREFNPLRLDGEES